MKKYVLDASVFLKFLLVEEEDNQKKALAILNLYHQEKIKIFLPALWYFEASNVFALKKNLDAEKYINALLELDFDIVSISKIIQKKAFLICKNYDKVSFYDAIYHAIAIENKYTLITADKKYYNNCKKEGFIILLDEFSN